MEDTYTFVDELKAFPEKIKPLEAVIKKILEETYSGYPYSLFPIISTKNVV